MNLWVIRHAKSSWADAGQADFDRPLNARGIENGKSMVRWMRAQKHQPEWIFSSDAARARATAEFVRDGYRIAEDRLVFDHRLYHASADGLLEVVRELPDECPSVALVGHNPGSSDFVNGMVGERAIELPTFGIARLNLPPRWRDARFGGATLAAMHTPKTLRDQS